MGRWRRWLPRRPTSRAGLLRARVTVLTLFALTVTLALLLAVRYRLAWPPVVVSILGGVPTLYVAWLAVPGVISPPESLAADIPAYGRPVPRWDPVELGVHQVIGGGPMPVYVRRPHDELLRTVLDPAVSASRLVVVRGRSSTGKTRAVYEAVAARLADWYLDYPLDPHVLNLRLEAGIPARTVLWLGELRQYVGAEDGAKIMGRLGDLLNDEGHLIITTLWPEHWAAYTAAARAGPGEADPVGTAGRLLERLQELAGRDPAGIEPARGGVIDVPDRFTPADLKAAARTGDPVLAAAAAASAAAGQDGQVVQYLAGVPDLLDRYAGHGGNPYGQAIITAAMDVTRLGHASPLPAALIQEAAVGYLTGPQRTKNIASWRDTALAWATEELRGAVRALEPVPSISGTGIAGYRVADYLIERASQELRSAQVPASTWGAILSYVSDPADAARLADSARNRGLHQYAISLYGRAADGGDWRAAMRLAGLLAERGDLKGLRARAEAGEWVAAARLTELLVQRGDVEGLRTQVATGDGHAATQLARLLAERGDLDGAVQVLRRPARAGDVEAVGELVRLLAERGDLDEAAQILRARAVAGDGYASGTLARLLAEGEDLPELRTRADAGDLPAAWWLAELLADRGDLDELRTRADAGDVYAALNLAGLLAERGDLKGLRARADTGDRYAAARLAGLLQARALLKRFAARNYYLREEVPGRSGEPDRYRGVIVTVAEQVLRDAIDDRASQADSDDAFRAAYPEWFDQPGATADTHHRRFRRARLDVRHVLQAGVRDELQP